MEKFNSKVKLGLKKHIEFRWEQLYWLEFEIRRTFDVFLKINRNQENFLEELEKILKKSIGTSKKECVDFTVEEQSQYLNHLYFYSESTIEQLQKLQRYSLIVSVFSFFESKLSDLCKNIESKFQFSIKLNDLNKTNGDISKYWFYLKKVVEIESKSVEPFFTIINQQRKIRNIIVHQDGFIDKEKTTRLTLIEGCEIQNIDNLSFIIIEQDIYVENILEKMDQFFKELFVCISYRFSELKNNKIN